MCENSVIIATLINEWNPSQTARHNPNSIKTLTIQGSRLAAF